mmetsp:Transcript_113588/g.285490  ORF Transcript_113588/g.285490 Transcript_113588/m.285490 type:complete len:239 (+) Transcript_113588:459-1175(+)
MTYPFQPRLQTFFDFLRAGIHLLPLLLLIFGLIFKVSVLRFHMIPLILNQYLHVLLPPSRYRTLAELLLSQFTLELIIVNGQGSLKDLGALPNRSYAQVLQILQLNCQHELRLILRLHFAMIPRNALQLRCIFPTLFPDFHFGLDVFVGYAQGILKALGVCPDGSNAGLILEMLQDNSPNEVLVSEVALRILLLIIYGTQFLITRLRQIFIKIELLPFVDIFELCLQVFGFFQALQVC